MNLRQCFAARLKEMREGKGLTQAEIGAQSYISALERGHKSVSLDQVEEFAARFRCDPRDLLMEPRR
jgi:transcriptional regulator with XRE-family HTH domain